jgi:hypothetical protein
MVPVHKPELVLLGVVVPVATNWHTILTRTQTIALFNTKDLKSFETGCIPPL